MSKRKRMTLFDDSFDEVGKIQDKQLKKLNPQSRCKEVTYFVNQPIIDSKTDDLKYDEQKNIVTEEKEYSFKNCFLQGLDKETIASKVNSTRQWLKNNLINMPIYLINGHSSFDARITFLKQYDDKGKRVTRREKAKRQKIEDDIREYKFHSQLKRGMSLMRYESSNMGPNFFTLPQGVFVIETTPVSFDAMCGYDTIRNFFKQNSVDNFNNFKQSFLSPKFNKLFYKSGTDESVRLIIPPQMSAFNKNYSFYDDAGENTYEKYGILKFTSDMSQEEIQANLNELEPIKIKMSDNNLKNDQKSTVFSNTQLKNKIMQSIDDNTTISLEQIINELEEPGIFLDFSCSGLVYYIFEPNPSGSMSRYVFDPDLEIDSTHNRENMVIYNTLMDSFEELERQYKLHMNNIVQADDISDKNFQTTLPHSKSVTFGTTKANELANKNMQLTMQKTGLNDPTLQESSNAIPVNVGGRKKRRKTKKKLPRLRKLSKKKVKHRYKLKNRTRKRRMAINEGVLVESRKRGMTMKKAAISKKGRFNLLRIYRRNRNPRACRKITRDMRYMDKKYKLGKTKNICKKKGKNRTSKKR